MRLFIGFIVFLGSSTIAFSQQFKIRDSKVELPPLSQPLYVVDGKAMPDLIRSKTDSTKMISPISEINFGDIEKIEIIKDESAVLAYGDAGKNGVVKITMKKH